MTGVLQKRTKPLVPSFCNLMVASQRNSGEQNEPRSTDRGIKSESNQVGVKPAPRHSASFSLPAALVGHHSLASLTQENAEEGTSQNTWGVGSHGAEGRDLVFPGVHRFSHSGLRLPGSQGL